MRAVLDLPINRDEEAPSFPSSFIWRNLDIKMGSNKALLLLALLVALVLVVSASRDLAAEKETDVTTESSNNVGGVDDAKYGGYGGNGGGYQGGYGGRGGYGGGGRGGGCYYGCCRRYNYGRGCRRCCSYAGEAVDSAEP